MRVVTWPVRHARQPKGCHSWGVTQTRRLILMRHAKAEPYAASDHERALTDRGAQSAIDAGRHLAAAGFVPDHVLVSSAARAVATWQAVAQALPPQATVDVTVDEVVYNGSPDVVIDALRGVPAGVRVLMFVGHNPTVGDLAQRFDDGEGDSGAIDALLHGFPAGAVVVYDVGVSWDALDDETGRVADFYVGTS